MFYQVKNQYHIKNRLVEFPLSCYTEGSFDEQRIALEWLLALFFSEKVKKSQ